MKKILIILTLLLLNLFICQNSVYSKTTPYRIVQDPEGVYIVEVNTAKSSLVPYVSEKLETNENVYKKTGAKLVINAGFFDPKNQKTVSYITINGNLKESPENNENLMNNKVLEPYMDKILNRSEFRILENTKGKLLYDIALHNDVIPTGYKLKHAIQAGPMLFPDLRLEE